MPNGHCRERKLLNWDWLRWSDYGIGTGLVQRLPDQDWSVGNGRAQHRGPHWAFKFVLTIYYVPEREKKKKHFVFVRETWNSHESIKGVFCIWRLIVSVCLYDLVPQSMYGCFPEVGLHLVFGFFRKASPPIGERHLDSFRASSSSDEARATIETDLGFWLFKSMPYILFKHVFWPKNLSESVKRLFSREQCKQASSPQSKAEVTKIFKHLINQTHIWWTWKCLTCSARNHVLRTYLCTVSRHSRL